MFTFGWSFLLTLLLEYPIVLLFGARNQTFCRKDLLLVLPVNLLTNPAAVALALYAQFQLRLPALPVQLSLEILVVLLEGFLYRTYGQAIAHPYRLSLCANGCSYTIGLLLHILC